MFRVFVAALVLTGMALCQYRCAVVCGAADPRGAESRAAPAGCPCCRTADDGPAPGETPASEEMPGPCDPDGDGECRCQGVCGGAITGEAPVLDGLIQAWVSAAVSAAAPQTTADVLSRRSRYVQGDPAAPGAADGRALRILISSLLT